MEERAAGGRKRKGCSMQLECEVQEVQAVRNYRDKQGYSHDTLSVAVSDKGEHRVSDMLYLTVDHQEQPDLFDLAKTFKRDERLTIGVTGVRIGGGRMNVRGTLVKRHSVPAGK